ncbi:Mariner Mos1 transposase [Eumeta japonica]|uniref:Mariner Mos1 transposase n=1 Tax=Eumeta variegata TaxID=151549 RepID=A0A4C1WZG0_EUMVA|nr:Mariner Mos1 transposase [Eumeta japonica]
MSKFEPNKRHLWELLIYFFRLKKSTAETHRLLVEAYNEAALSERTCREWFQKFKIGDFDVEHKDRSGRPKIYEDAELEEDSSQTQKELALTLEVTQQAVSHRLKSLGIIHKRGDWVPYELKQRDVERRCMSEMLLARQKKKVLHRIVTRDEKHDKTILLHDNVRPHVAVPGKNYLKTLDWKVLPHPPYSPDIAPSDYHLFQSMAHVVSEQRFTSYEDTKNWIDSWIPSKDKEFFRLGIRKLLERWKKVVASDGQYFD